MGVQYTADDAVSCQTGKGELALIHSKGLCLQRMSGSIALHHFSAHLRNMLVRLVYQQLVHLLCRLVYSLTLYPVAMGSLISWPKHPIA